jgi:KaiC/GvpD/RAD55 family RecA-like ATPase
MSKKQTLSEELAGEGDAKFLEKLKVYMPSITEYFKTSKERVKTGVEGLDQLMEGGLINRSVVLVSGKTGTGKTIFTSQFLYRGIMDYKENGIFVSTEETAADLLNDMNVSFGWDFLKLIKENRFRILQLEPDMMERLPQFLKKLTKEVGAKRLVIDSASMFGLYLGDEYKTRKEFHNILREAKKLGLTTLVTAEVLEGSKGLSRFGVVEFIADGIISLMYIGLARKYKRALLIRKMRRTEHSDKIHPIDITENGMKIVKLAKEEK